MAKKTPSKKSRTASSSAAPAPAVADDRKKAWGENYRPRYSGVATFMRRPLCESEESRDGVDIGIIGVPFDGGVTNRTGARHGPRHLREQSTFMGLSNHQTGVRPYDLAQVADLGDVLIQGVYRLEEAIDDIERYYDGVAAAGILPLSAGGDHSISLPILKALAKVHGQPLAMVHFDAHCDTGSELFGHKHHHGGPFRVAAEEGALDPKRTIQIGIRGPSEPLWQYSYDSGMTVIHIEKLYEMGLPAVIKKARSVVGKQPVYVSFDVDGLDPVYAPGTGTPETGGFSTFEAQQMLRGLSGLNIVGGDVVEVAPSFDPSGVTGLTGAQMMFEILCLLSQTVERRKKSGKPKSVSKGAAKPAAKSDSKAAAKDTSKTTSKASAQGAAKPAAKRAAKSAAKSAATGAGSGRAKAPGSSAKAGASAKSKAGSKKT
ncbi:agmatinase [Thioalkalivibrio sp. HK1]|uniref:agmatinase n=1 Tax=Thioalkalivibrio sp. HK1 TaxID=1469245 RepID=UPI000471B1B6|nr:agmatinase [Thioalkalivibrio sp. HK1]